MFKRLRGSEGFFLAFLPGRDPQRHYRTYREGLLCSKCEGLLSGWETYASRVFYGGVPLEGRWHGEHLFLDNVDYVRMKLFLMSMLWRFSVTTIPGLRGDELAGPHPERLRKLLLHSDPAEPWRYGCVLVALRHGDTHLHDIIVAPSQCKLQGHRCHRIIVGGFGLFFVVSSSPPAGVPTEMLLQKDGKLLVTSTEMRDLEFLTSTLARVARTKPPRV